MVFALDKNSIIITPFKNRLHSYILASGGSHKGNDPCYTFFLGSDELRRVLLLCKVGSKCWLNVIVSISVYKEEAKQVFSMPFCSPFYSLYEFALVATPFSQAEKLAEKMVVRVRERKRGRTV